MVEDFYLYILMRNDMDSLNAGKAVAQGAHAANVFGNKMLKSNSKYQREFRKWAGKRGYGTTITLSANEEELRALMNDDSDYERDVIIDETYPLRDGKVTHYFPCLTCGYIFAPRGYHGLKHLSLMR